MLKKLVNKIFKIIGLVVASLLVGIVIFSLANQTFDFFVSHFTHFWDVCKINFLCSRHLFVAGPIDFLLLVLLIPLLTSVILIYVKKLNWKYFLLTVIVYYILLVLYFYLINFHNLYAK